jgi:hypothetical protein
MREDIKTQIVKVNDLWRSFIDVYKSRFNGNVPAELENVSIESFFYQNADSVGDIFDEYINVSLKIVLTKIVVLLNRAIEHFQKNMDNLGEKEVFVIIDKLTGQLKVLYDIHSKINKDKASGSQHSESKIEVL